jgi:hypothetical protein
MLLSREGPADGDDQLLEGAWCHCAAIYVNRKSNR